MHEICLSILNYAKLLESFAVPLCNKPDVLLLTLLVLFIFRLNLLL